MLYVVFLIFVFATSIQNGVTDFVECIADCIELNMCYEAKTFLQEKGIQPQICGFNGAEPLVCCAEQDEQTLFKIHYSGLRKADKKCKEINPPDIPRRNKPNWGHGGGGYGGWTVTDYDFPFVAALGYESIENPLYRCGAVLIESNILLTAAHCAKINGGPPLVARVGSIALLSNDSIPIQIVKVISHPNYNHVTEHNDIAIVVLAEHSQLQTACIFKQRLNLRHFNRTIALGFGTEEFGGKYSDNLMKTYYNVIYKRFCESEYKDKTIIDSQLCALGERRVFDNGTSLVQDTCQGDSGGPLILDRNNRYVVGLVSYGPLCGSEKPGIYTHIAPYYDWINSTIREEGNQIQFNGCFTLDPPYITISLCNGEGPIGKSCSGVALTGFSYSIFGQAMVRLGYGDRKNPVYDCDGFLIDNNVVITAAQCAQINGKVPLLVQTENDYYKPKQIVKILVHPNYDPNTYLNDIAIIFLGESVLKGEGSPACLWSSSFNLTSNIELDAVGFGTTSYDGPLKTHLVTAKLNLTDKSFCNKNTPLPNSQLCVLTHTDYIGEDTYQVNSGGPIFLKSNDFNAPRYVVGLVSYGKGRIIYTNILSYLDWIESIVWPDGTKDDNRYIA